MRRMLAKQAFKVFADRFQVGLRTLSVPCVHEHVPFELIKTAEFHVLVQVLNFALANRDAIPQQRASQRCAIRHHFSYGCKIPGAGPASFSLRLTSTP